MHVAQNIGMKKLLGHPEFGRSVGEHFTRGLLGQRINPVKRFFSSLVGGVAIPEPHAMRTHAYELGEKLRHNLRAKGIQHIDADTLNTMQRALQVGPRAMNIKNPHVQVLAETMRSHPWFSGMGQSKELHKMYHDPRNPLYSNIAKNLVQPGVSPSVTHVLPATAASGRKADLAGGLIGSSAALMIDPATGVMNAFKTVATNPTSRKFFNRFRPLKKALNWVDNTFAAKPVKQFFQKGQASTPISKSREFAHTYGLNPVVGSAMGTANRTGLALPSMAKAASYEASKADTALR